MKDKILFLDMAGYGTGIGSIALAMKDIQNIILGVGGVVLLSLQIYLNIIRIKKERRAHDSSK